MLPPIVLIGPVCAGKTTQASLLAAALRWPRRPLPALFATAVDRIVAEHPDHVVDLGAGHTHLVQPVLRAKLRHALTPCPNVILLLPSPDADRSIRILKERSMRARGHGWVRDGQDHILRWVKNSPNDELATMIVYTGGSAPEQTRDEILGRLA